MVAFQRYHCESYSTGGNHLGKHLSSKQCSAGGCLAWVPPANVKVLFLLPRIPWDELCRGLVMIVYNVRMKVYLWGKMPILPVGLTRQGKLRLKTNIFFVSFSCLLDDFHSQLLFNTLNAKNIADNTPPEFNSKSTNQTPTNTSIRNDCDFSIWL